MMSRLFRVSFLLALVCFAALSVVNASLVGPMSPRGIISFEFCGYAGSCRVMVDAWGPAGQLSAALSLGLDYLFMLLYPATLFLGLLLVADRVPRRLKRLTTALAWAAWAAGAADAVENYCLIRILMAPAAVGYGLAASVFATAKFLVLAVTLAWLLFAWARWGRAPSST